MNLKKLAQDNQLILKYNNIDSELGGQMHLEQTKCGKNVCENFYLELGDFSNENYKEQPQLLFVGGFHGDEQVGPNIIYYFIEYIIENKDSFLVSELIKERLLVLVPLVNPSGYYANLREEQQQNGQQIDINRDFPYKNENCFKSTGGRIINYLFKKYIFMAGITFHGGMYALSYPWGSSNHYNKSTKEISFTEDNSLFEMIGIYMKNNGPGNLKMQEYPVGTLNSEIYPADGTLEDWAYSGSEQMKNNKLCQGVDQKEMAIEEQQLKSLFYLIECSDPKKPEEKLLGGKEGINDNKSKQYGHIARNINIIKSLSESVRPLVLLETQNLGDFELQIQWKVQGCYEIDDIQLSYLNQYKQWVKIFEGKGQGSISSKQTLFVQKIKFYEKLYVDLKIQVYCDQLITNNKMKTHLAQAKINPNYKVVNGNYKLESQTQFVKIYKQVLVEQKKQVIVSQIGFIQSKPEENYSVTLTLLICFVTFFVLIILGYFIYTVFYKPKFIKIIEQQRNYQKQLQVISSSNNNSKTDQEIEDL